MTKPKFPIITVYKDFPELVLSEIELEKSNALAVLKLKNVKAYDAEGIKWRYDLKSEQVKNNFWTRLTANTFYNPTVQTQPIWTKMDSYTIEEIQVKLKECINKDDDLLTQFIGSEELIRAIDKAKDFKDLCSILQKLTIDPLEYEEQKI